MELHLVRKLDKWKSRTYLISNHEKLFEIVFGKKDASIVNFKTNEEELIIKIIRSIWAWKQTKYSVLKDNEVYLFKIISSFKFHYQLTSDRYNYEIFGHKKNMYSIFEDGKQIGYFIDPPTSVLNTFKLKIVINSDSNIPLILAFIMILKLSDGENIDGVVSFQFGPFWKTKRDFDYEWKPK